ncbi:MULTISPECIES: hypothetical protein [Bacillaceae]|uniref:WYL domain-containing protein n=1 Tax=Oceanobacillus caeni TaxID=405946 RepID=A0ABR5MGB3_9BACI|nr:MULTISPECIES: hypothetical protein [Bacillaceae]KPH71571.1 hypothetical protein AFL42_14780 [Oceanobacillus caeni]MBU8792418.1 WYL domain-containing protein [Oceanobacillus caeni]MED4474324.1 hypothetical protein [Oceanobacillus caeni]
MIKLLNHSLQTREKIKIIYYSNDKKLSQRTIKVIKMNDSNVLAYCYMKHSVRVFKLDNILAVESVYRKPG